MRKLLPRTPASRGRVDQDDCENGTHSEDAEDCLIVITFSLQCPFYRSIKVFLLLNQVLLDGGVLNIFIAFI